MAQRLSVDAAKLLETLRSTVFQKATNEELMALTVVANTYDLNPFLKEIYAFPAKGGGIVPIVSVDGWNKMLVRHPEFDGIEFEFADNGQGDPYSCTATVHLKNRSHPVRVTEYLDECKRNTDPWNNMPRRMLRNRTLCQAARMAFGFSGITNEDEAAAIVVESSTSPVPTEPPPKMVAAPSAEKKPSPQAELEALVLQAGYDFNLVQRFGSDSGTITNADTLADWSEIPTEEARRLLRNKTGFLTSLKQLKGA